MSETLYTGEYPIADIASPLARVGVAARDAAARQVQMAGLEAKKKKAQSEALQVHPYAQDIADQFWNQTVAEAMPYMGVEDGYKVIEGMVKGYVSSIEDLRMNPDMREAESNLELYLDPNNAATKEFDASLGSMAKSNVTMDFIDQRRNYQYSGLFQEGTTETYYDRGRFGMKGVPLGVNGELLANEPLDLLDHPMFNSPQAFTPPTRMVSDTDASGLAQTIITARIKTQMDFDPEFLSSLADNNTGYGDWFQGMMDTDQVDENSSDRFKFRFNAFLKSKDDRQDVDEEGNVVLDDYGQPVIVPGLKSLYPDMEDEELFRYFMLNPNDADDSKPGGNRTLYKLAEDALSDYWFTDIMPKLERTYRTSTGNSLPPDEFYYNNGYRGTLKSNVMEQFWRNPENLNFSTGTNQNLGKYTLIALRSPGSQGIQDTRGTFLKPEYANQAAFWIGQGYVSFDSESQTWTQGDNLRDLTADSPIRNLVQQMVTGNPNEDVVLEAMGFIDGRNDIILVKPAGRPYIAAIPYGPGSDDKRTIDETSILANLNSALMNANPKTSLDDLMKRHMRRGTSR
jgi:hypothetical protein